jgi:3-mercaptopyruvate sulfurtransferase SseA
MRRTVLLAFPLMLFALAGCKSASAPSGDLKSLTIDQVDQRIQAHDGKTFVYDDNNKDRYAQGHLPGAKWLDEDAVTANDLPADKGATLIFYCANEL